MVEEELLITKILDHDLEIKSKVNQMDLTKVFCAKRGSYYKTLEKYPQYDLFDTIETLKKDKRYEILTYNIEHIKREILFNSNIHGIAHNEKVLLLAFIIGCFENINSIDMQVLLDAAKYHDIGRSNDGADGTHGHDSAEKVDKAVKYDKDEDEQILKYIIEAHSLSDIFSKFVLAKYKINDKKRAVNLHKILKDADALDRIRISRDLSSDSDLNPKYLRTDTAKRMIKLSHQLDQLFAWDKEEKKRTNDFMEKEFTI